MHNHSFITDYFMLSFGCRDFLLECARKVNLEGAAEFLQDPNNGLKEVFSYKHIPCMLHFDLKWLGEFIQMHELTLLHMTVARFRMSWIHTQGTLVGFHIMWWVWKNCSYFVEMQSIDSFNIVCRSTEVENSVVLNPQRCSWKLLNLQSRVY